jgi:DNA polymerase-3 subunit gamma/tau
VSEIALYRKYRPKKLKGIVGQDHIKQYFQNAVSKNKISHAYLLSGTRGVGKTTIARIISLIVNCENGPSIDYDVKSKICSAILDNGAAGDVVELDAATNSSIDNIREIRKMAMTYPVMCRKRVFIIDEVHSLRGAAANALLHILEEPPESSMFILATTESHKILPTIKSRCQKFELKTLSVAEISSYLTKICNNEGYDKIENGAMQIIAQAAHGSIRDSLSILEPILSRCESGITVDIVRECIGSRLGQFFFCDLLEYIINKKSREAIVSIKKAIGSGMEPINIFNE